MKVCFVNPPSIAAEKDDLHFTWERAPLGILTLAAILERAGHTPEVVDLNVFYPAYRNLHLNRSPAEFLPYAAERIAATEADVYGFTTISSTYPLSVRLASHVKAVHPDRAVVLGGPQASVVDTASMKAFPFVDVIVRGEADDTVLPVLDALGGSGTLADVPGVTYRSKGEAIRNSNASPVVDLDSTPMPAYHLYPRIDSDRAAALEVGRGCPFACTFCSTNDFFRRKFRLKSPEVVLEQMRTLHRRFGIRRFTLAHDMFTVDRKRVVAFCQAFITAQEDFHWSVAARSDCVDPDLIRLMAEAGCRAIFFGIESGSDTMQTLIKKRLDLGEAADNIEFAAGQGMGIQISTIIGFPEETREDLRDTVGFLVDVSRFERVDPQLNLLVPLAETPIHTQHRDRLVPEDRLSDISYHGWPQGTAEQELILAHPDIFPNFYAIPPRSLDRSYLRELREFVLNGLSRFRLLMVALNRATGDLVRVFDDWKTWCSLNGIDPVAGRDPMPYYNRVEFRRDFLPFIRENLLHRCDGARHVISSLLDLTAAVDSAHWLDGDEGNSAGVAAIQRGDLDVIPRLASGVRLVHVSADLGLIVNSLRRNDDLRLIPKERSLAAVRELADGHIEFVRLNRLAQRILAACDGTRTVEDVATTCASEPFDRGGDVGTIQAIERLGGDGLLELRTCG